MSTKRALDAGQGIEGNEPNPREEVGTCTTVPPTSADISHLMQTMPKLGAPAAERTVWLERKRQMLSAIEQAKR